MTKAGPAYSPTIPGTKLSVKQAPSTLKDTAFMLTVPYQCAVGTLMHIAIYTHLDISKAVQTVAQFMANPRHAHWAAVKHILSYLKTTKSLQLTLNSGSPNPGQILAYCNANHTSSVDHTRSTLGYVIFIGCGAVLWSAKKQTTTALSTGKAEYYMAVYAGQEIMWMWQLLANVGYPQAEGTTLRSDSTSALKNIVTSDEVSNQRKHIRIAYHWLHKAVKANFVSPKFIPGVDNTADILTKGLDCTAHKRHVLNLGLTADENTC
jgi:hypothetical protein